VDAHQPVPHPAQLPSAPPARGHHTRRPRWLTRLLDALLALGIGSLTGLIAHRFAGEEPLSTDAEYVGHLFAELTIVVLAAVIAYWLLDDIRAARSRPRAQSEAPPE
jgi:hypothetical protein